jgi:ABC-type polysaccharide/polyol phosphate transport system ATPase subunit
MSDILVKVENVSKKFCRSLKKSLWYGMKDLGSELIGGTHSGNAELRPDEFWAVNDVSFELKRGECLGLIGRNGAGKTTLLRMLNGLIKPDKGRIEMRGRVGALIALGAGFNPILTGRENIYVNASVLGLSKIEIDEKFEEIVDFAELAEFIDAPVQSYSSGMAVRLGFAVASIVNTDILIIDEVLAVGDFRFRWKCLEKIKDLRSKGLCIMLVSHNTHDLMRTCELGLLLDAGKSITIGNIHQTLHTYEGLVQDKCPSHKSMGDWVIEDVFFENIDNAESFKPNSKIVLCMDLYCKKPLIKGRIIVGLFHSELGAIFHVSSFRDKKWFSFDTGLTRLIVEFEGFMLQFGTCHAEVSLRGEKISDIYDLKQTRNKMVINTPIPNYEGFGVNGGILPNCLWNIQKVN